jgi:hypothetical protein
VVVTDGAVARVGSQLNDLRHVSQVALEAGERVTILEHMQVAGGRHAGAWVRIEPPSGEFRWARAEDLALPPALAPVPDPAAVTDAAGLAAAGVAVDAIRDAGSAVTQAVAEFDAAAETAAQEPASGMTKLLSGWLPRGTNVFDRSTPAAPPPARLAPEQKPRPSPVRTIARAPPLPAARSLKAWASSAARSMPAAFIVAGSAMVTIATPSFTDNLIFV